MMLGSTVLLTSLAESVSANPISTPFDYAFEIAVVNFPINGFLLLGVYFALIKRGAHIMYFGPRNFVIVFLMCTGIISFTGGIVDSAAYTTRSVPVFLVATALIGVIAGLVAHRYLRLEFEASWVVGVVFFTVNLASWSILANDTVIIIAWDFCIAIWIVSFLFFVTLLIVAKGHQGGIKARRYSAMSAPQPRPTFPSEPSAYPVKVRSPDVTETSKGIVMESVVVAGCCLFMLMYAYTVWMF